MATSGFGIVFAPDVDQAVTAFWDGNAQVPITDTSTSTDTGLFFTSRGAANAALAALISRYPGQHIAVVPATHTLAYAFPSTPEVLPPPAPHS